MAHTLASPCQFHEDIRNSRFITLAGHADSPAAAQAFIDQFSDSNATHNCWAWKVGQQYRFNDDGEPTGTAGRPILAAIEGQGFDQVVVLVIRWYGGIQLGTGGLSRAYGGGANKCLQAGERQQLVERIRCSCHCQFAELPRLKPRLAEFDTVIEHEAFTAQGVDLDLAINAEHFDGFAQFVADLTRGRETLISP
ncbi:IMPACT family protein [Pseudomonas sp. S9]|uniref:IMPACT family protein n=1 Tax=Pseudomonas sp. S9 TaxID=686578 RepID=UPI00025575AC|nr:YigZ family protein [Pseudomonas sp. S9]